MMKRPARICGQVLNVGAILDRLPFFWPLMCGILLVGESTPSWAGPVLLWSGVALLVLTIIIAVLDRIGIKLRSVSWRLQEEIDARAHQWTEEELKWAGKDKPDAGT